MAYQTESEDEFDDDDIQDEDLVHIDTASFTSGGKRPDTYDHYNKCSTKKPKTDAISLLSVSIARDILKKTWGYAGFRLAQEAAISRLIEGGNALAIFPTGGGKSLVYQIPALAFDTYDEYCGRTRGGGVTLVISPLIALMKVRGIAQMLASEDFSLLRTKVLVDKSGLMLYCRIKLILYGNEESVRPRWTLPKAVRNGSIPATT